MANVQEEAEHNSIDARDEENNDDHGKKYHSSTLLYDINVRLILFMQLYGLGRNAIRQLVSILGLSTSIYSLTISQKLRKN